jgi:hypothetical protein
LAKANKILATGKRGTKIYRAAHQSADLIASSDAVHVAVQVRSSRHPRAGQISPDSLLGRSIAILREEGKPLHAKDISERLLKRMGVKANVPSLVGALARATKIDRPLIYRANLPNVFGLTEWQQPQLRQPVSPQDLPATYWLNQVAAQRHKGAQ